MKVAADWRLAVATGGAAGLAASPFWAPDGDWLRPLLAVALIAVVLVDRGRVGGVAICLVGLAAALAGLLVGTARIQAIDGGALEALPGEAAFSGFALEAPSGTRGTLRFPFESDRGRVLVESSAGPTVDVAAGVGLEVEGDLVQAPDWMREDLRRRGIGMVLRADRIEPNGQERAGPSGWIDRLRNRAFAALAVAVPEREAALFRGFVLGDDSAIDERTTEDFRNSGLAHLLAVSGQNIVLLALLAVPFLSVAGVGPRARLLAVAALILVYIPLAGGGPSIQRAGVMGLAGLVAVAATRAPSRVYALALAALVTLVLNPRATGDIGWQLSFAAVTGIMLLARPLQVRLMPLVGNRGWRRVLCEGIAVTAAATVATAPLMVIHFEQLPVATLIANLAAMPAVAPAMWLGMISIAAGQISPLLAAPTNLAGSLFLAWIAQVAEWFGRPSWAVLEVKSPGPVGLLLLVLLPGVMVVALRRFRVVSEAPVRPGRWIPAALAILTSLVLVIPQVTGTGRRDLGPPPPGGVRVEMLDIGQGDAILIRPSGTDPLLIDGGPPGGDLPGALESAGVESLAAVVLTHPDLDHYGGLPGIFGRFAVARFLFDRAPADLISQARAAGAVTGRIAAGDLIRQGDVRLEILWPPGDRQPATLDQEGIDSNLRSIVTLFGWHGFRMLLTGDAEAEAVPMHPGPIDVLKVSHHGSEDTGLPGLLDETRPRLAVIQVGEDNSYGHPVPDVLAALTADRVETLRTDQVGTVSIVLGNGNGFEVETGE